MGNSPTTTENTKNTENTEKPEPDVKPAPANGYQKWTAWSVFLQLLLWLAVLGTLVYGVIVVLPKFKFGSDAEDNVNRATSHTTVTVDPDL